MISRGMLVRIVSSPATVAAADRRSKRQRAAAGDGDGGPRQGVMDANCQSLPAVALGFV